MRCKDLRQLFKICVLSSICAVDIIQSNKGNKIYQVLLSVVLGLGVTYTCVYMSVKESLPITVWHLFTNTDDSYLFKGIVACMSCGILVSEGKFHKFVFT